MSVNIDKHRCPQNHRCPAISVCKFGALSQEGFNAPTIDEDKCTDCGKCARFCPMGALQAVKKPKPKDNHGDEASLSSSNG